MTKRGGHQQEKDMHVLKHIHNNISRLQVIINQGRDRQRKAGR